MSKNSYEEMIHQLNEAQMELKIRLEQVSRLRSECSKIFSMFENAMNENLIPKNKRQVCCSWLREVATGTAETLQAAVFGDTGNVAGRLRANGFLRS